MIPLAIMYIFCIVCFVIFLITRKSLKNLDDGEVTRREKILYSLNLMGFIASLVYTLMVLFIEVLALSVSRSYEFLNDVFSTPTYFMLVCNVVLFLGIGYILGSRESYAQLDLVTSRWLLLIILLILLTGIIGLLTGIMI